MTELVLISGPCGVGKTSTAAALSAMMQDRDVPHCYVDMDALTYTFPRPAYDRFADALAIENLTAIWANAQKAGARYLIVPRVAETVDYPTRIARALGIEAVHLCRLTATPEDLRTRIYGRSSGKDAEWHLNRALELIEILDACGGEDIKIDTTGKTRQMVAAELSDWLGWTP